MPDGKTDFYYTSEDGLKLYAAVYGDDNRGALPVVCLPGLTRNARDFHELAIYLSTEASPRRKVVAFDYRGRGNSERDKNWRNYDVLVEARDVIAGLAATGIERAAFIGTSRGGLIVMALAALLPGVLKAAVLNDIGPVVSGEGLAMIRAYLERAPRPRTLEEAVSIQKGAVGQSFGALMDEDWERMVRAIYRQDKRTLVPDYDKKLLNGLKNFDPSKPLPELWPQFLALSNIPVLVVRGANSRLLTAETLEEMARRHPNMESVIVQGQGHAPLLETGELPQLIARFLAKADGRPGTKAT